MTARGRAALSAALLLLVAGTARAAMPVPDPDWPCQQIKVAHLSLGAIWDGPDVTPYVATWSQDARVAALAERIAPRRLPLAEAQQAIRDFAAASGAHRREGLLALMAGLFHSLDAERAQVVAGLDRFGHRQKELAVEVRADMDRLRTQQAANPAEAAAQVGRLGDQIGWETRVFEQRRQTIRFACAVPDTIEQRLFALARTISAALGQATP